LTSTSALKSHVSSVPWPPGPRSYSMDAPP
jgi:hypothetical protein